jgi:DNA-binding NarL/FixJ family response regulator
MRILLADNLENERTVLKQLLKYDSELSVVGEAVDADDLLARLQKTLPDLVLLSWELPGLPAADLLDALSRLTHPIKVIVFSKHNEARRAALVAGADAFVSKDGPVEQLLNTVRAVGRLSPCFV